MPIITLTSDWGLKDHYTGAVKGTLLSQLPDAVILDITHEIDPFDLNQAAFVFRNSYRHFPEGTIHLIGINTEADPKTPHTVIFHRGYYFIGSDNGLFSLIFDEIPDQMVELEIMQDSDYFTFSTRDVFVKAAVLLARGAKMEELGKPRKTLLQKTSFVPVVDGNLIKGKVIYVDKYENAFVNITEEFFRKTVKGKKFSILLKSVSHPLTSISKSYRDVPEGEMVALFSTTGYLEIAINKGNAAGLLGLKPDTPIMIEIGK